jgi:hypothetical protein
MDRVQAQTVNVKVADPRLCALDRPLANAVTKLVIIVDCIAPEGVVRSGEVGAEGHERLSARGADVVVDDVEDYRQIERMRGIDESL